MEKQILGKTVIVVEPTSLYKWAKVWGKVQKSYYPEPILLRREKQIHDFIHLNQFTRIYLEKDTDILKDLVSASEPKHADLVVITDQKFSRLPCDGIIERIQALLTDCPNLLICLNRHYINIDGEFCDTTLDQHFPIAITQWLKKSLPNASVLDLSLDVVDRGDWFTWVVPDRFYYISV